MLPSVPIVTVLTGTSFFDPSSAFLTIMFRPEQQGTSILTTVMSLTSLRLNISVSLSIEAWTSSSFGQAMRVTLP